MPKEDREISLEKATAFFTRAEDVAATENFDYAIEMYLEGLRRAPDSLEDGHAGLRKLALIRQGKGGRKPSVTEKFKHRGGKTPLEQMLSAEYLLAKDPDNLSYADTMLKACVAGLYKRTAAWIARLIFDANRASVKPSFSTYILLKDSYIALNMFSKATTACQLACNLRPIDTALQDELRDLSAKMTMQKGKYEEDGDFRKAIKNRDVQERLHSQEKLVKTVEFREIAVSDTRKAVETDPTSTDKILKLANALCDVGTAENFDEALSVLENAYIQTRDFTLKRRQGELMIRKLRKDVRTAKARADADVSDGKLKNQLAAATEQLDKVELDHYKLCTENYPNDLHIKYEYGLCLIKSKMYDEAIPLLQEAQKDPRRRIIAMDETGLCFFLKGWYADAIDIFKRALESCEVNEDETAKDLRYNLARSYEEDGQADKALEYYRRLAQLDFGYKDVSRRVERLRNANK